MITICNARKNYSNQVQIDPINLKIKQAGVISIIGPNGAGKSTTALMIGRLLNIDDGQISVEGCDVGQTSSSELPKILAILKQENHFITKLTLKQLVSFGRFPHSHGRINQEDTAMI